jgi:N-terminal EH-domain containing protein
MTENNHNANGESEDRTAVIASRLKQLYSKSILPVEKKYRYDYFFDSPLLSDVEFDGTILQQQQNDWLSFRHEIPLELILVSSVFDQCSSSPAQPNRKCYWLDSIQSEKLHSSAIY